MAGPGNGIGLTLALVPEEPSAASGQGQWCRLVLRNQATGPVWVNRRLAVNHPVSPPHLREVDFLVQDAHGRVAEFAAKVRVGRPGPEDFVELAPGETVERPFDLTFYYDLVPGGEYEVLAVYENYCVPEDLRDARVWTGRLASHPLKVTPATEAPAPA
jgi:hypothetical protein